MIRSLYRHLSTRSLTVLCDILADAPGIIRDHFGAPAFLELMVREVRAEMKQERDAAVNVGTRGQA